MWAPEVVKQTMLLTTGGLKTEQYQLFHPKIILIGCFITDTVSAVSSDFSVTLDDVWPS